ncbi:MAG: undecaprenyldiphospho-muramoylpentapeptide beta-N-acetylglucosaminyltransferase [candidate division Zixibacteria bacterium RBG_16_50_21]|nr:MAG: undecaprenyldiphospho-muramoylpentapeptide beta-N-acetylglucosaminyltransferase [candidate division Zixibacteria bacterium RBG_16_50_21]
MPKIMLAGGGTGGHLFPAIAIAEELKKRRADVEIVFVGTERGLEAKMLPEFGYRLESLEVRGLTRKLDWRNLFFLYHLVKSLNQAKRLLKEERPDVVIGTGGYASGPPLFVASTIGIPTLVQEQNSYPGLTTRSLAKRANKVFLAYEEAKKFFKRQNNLEVVGNPVRPNFKQIDRTEARKKLGLDPNHKVILVVGGSQGAVAVNQAILLDLDLLEGKNTLQLVWQTGQNDIERVKTLLSGRKLPVTLVPFIQEMGACYTASDLVISRAGALTLAEITLCGKPAILIPYPHAAADHQRHNAEVLVNAGAAEMILEKDLRITRPLSRALELLKDERKLSAMSEQSLKLARPEALDKIVSEILKYLGKDKN